MLKDGSFLKVDPEFRSVVKYAQEREGNNQEQYKKHRRTCLDGESDSVTYSDEFYNGYFTVRLSDDGLFVEVVDGRHPEYQYCGRCDLPYSENVKAVKFPIKTFQVVGEKSVLIGASWNSGTGYQAHIFISGEMPEEMMKADRFCTLFTLGVIYTTRDKNGVFAYEIVQTYKEDGVIQFGDAYIL